MSHQNVHQRCPDCGSFEIRLSRRRGIEWLAPFFGLSSYRCRQCSAIFFQEVEEEQPAAEGGTAAGGWVC